MAELIGFNRRTGQPVQAAAGAIGSYAELNPEFYKTFRPDSWQHAGSSGWQGANVPGWGMNPMLQMGPRRAVDGVPTVSNTMLYGFLVLIAVTGYVAVKEYG